MRVRMLTLLAGPDGCFAPGSVATVPDEQGHQLVDGGYAEAFLEPAAPTAPEPPSEPVRASGRKKAKQE